jgi:alkanesulfonate monooxygenase SsuD/methylene tetrahydromethanopterin reductase-like flavin-dependent oxidoreductase (luciferase family)
MDEYMRALKTALSGEEFTFLGTGYEAFGNRVKPGPIQKPHPPLLVGGNSKRAIRRAVELGDGWCPFFTPASVSVASTRTAAMSDEMDLVAGIRYLREHCEKVGRQRPPDIVLSSIGSLVEQGNAAAMIDKIGELEALGATGAAVHIEGSTRAEWCDNAERFAADVLAKLPGDRV